MCKLCEIEHSDRWTCAQAKANNEDWKPVMNELIDNAKLTARVWTPPVYVPRKEWKHGQKG